MPNGNNMSFENFISKTKIYIIVIAILLGIICFLDFKLIPLAILLLILIIGYAIWSDRRRKAELSQQLKDLTFNVNTTAKTTLINSPFPLAMVETNGNLIWKSEKFAYEFEKEDTENILDNILQKVKTLIEESNNKDKGKITTELQLENKHYQVMGSYVKSHKRNRAKKTRVHRNLVFH